jgi:hypothetical protein
MPCVNACAWSYILLSYPVLSWLLRFLWRDSYSSTCLARTFLSWFECVGSGVDPNADAPNVSMEMEDSGSPMLSADSRKCLFALHSCRHVKSW